MEIKLSKNNDHDGVSHGVECSQEGDRISLLKSNRQALEQEQEYYYYFYYSFLCDKWDCCCTKLSWSVPWFSWQSAIVVKALRLLIVLAARCLLIWQTCGVFAWMQDDCVVSRRALSCPEIPDIPEILKLSWNSPEIRSCPEILVIW